MSDFASFKARRIENLRRAKVANQVKAANALTPEAGRYLSIAEAMEYLRRGDDVSVISLRGVDLQAFVGPSDSLGKELEPRTTLVLYIRLFRARRLRVRHLMALDIFVSDAASMLGSSNGMTSQADAVIVDRSRELRDATSYIGVSSSASSVRMNHLMDNLNQDEKRLLLQTIIEPEKVVVSKDSKELVRQGDVINAQSLGQEAGFKDKTSRSAAGTAIVQYLLSRIARIYGF